MAYSFLTPQYAIGGPGEPKKPDSEGGNENSSAEVKTYIVLMLIMLLSV